MRARLRYSILYVTLPFRTFSKWLSTICAVPVHILRVVASRSKVMVEPEIFAVLVKVLQPRLPRTEPSLAKVM